MTSNLPISEQYAEAAAQWVDADAAADILETTKSAVLAEMMGRAMTDGAKSIAAAEQIVKATPEWRDHVIKIVEARREANHHKVTLEYLRMKFQEFMSQEANARIEVRL